MANLYSSWLEEEPTALYGWYNQKGTPYQKNYWANNYGGVRQGYMGELANQVQQGQDPSLQWSDYLKNYPWLEEWNKLNPYSRGERQSTFNPRKSWMIY